MLHRSVNLPKLAASVNLILKQQQQQQSFAGLYWCENLWSLSVIFPLPNATTPTFVACSFLREVFAA